MNGNDSAPAKTASALKCSADACPVITAKGEGFLAERMALVAREHGVPILQDFQLSRQLADIPLGEEIPQSLYFAIAGMLGYVFEMEELTAPGTNLPIYEKDNGNGGKT